MIYGIHRDKFVHHRFIPPISIPYAHLRGSPPTEELRQFPSPFPFQKKKWWSGCQPSLPLRSSAQGWAAEFPFTGKTRAAISRTLGFTRDANNRMGVARRLAVPRLGNSLHSFGARLLVTAGCAAMQRAPAESE